MLKKGKEKQKEIKQSPLRQVKSHPILGVLKYVGLMLFFVLMGLWWAARPIQHARLLRQIKRLQQTKAELMEIQARLHLEKAALCRLDRVEKRARRDYGFIDPNRSQIINISIDESSFP